MLLDKKNLGSLSRREVARYGVATGPFLMLADHFMSIESRTTDAPPGNTEPAIGAVSDARLGLSHSCVSTQLRRRAGRPLDPPKCVLELQRRGIGRVLSLQVQLDCGCMVATAAPLPKDDGVV